MVEIKIASIGDNSYADPLEIKIASTGDNSYADPWKGGGGGYIGVWSCIAFFFWCD